MKKTTRCLTQLEGITQEQQLSDSFAFILLYLWEIGVLLLWLLEIGLLCLWAIGVLTIERLIQVFGRACVAL